MEHEQGCLYPSEPYGVPCGMCKALLASYVRGRQDAAQAVEDAGVEAPEAWHWGDAVRMMADAARGGCDVPDEPEEQVVAVAETGDV